jgi:archaellum component FlaC
MADDLREFVHERFRRTDEKLDKLVELMTGFAKRLNSLERQVAGLRVDFAHLREDIARMDHRMDRSTLGSNASSAGSILSMCRTEGLCD